MIKKAKPFLSVLQQIRNMTSGYMAPVLRRKRPAGRRRLRRAFGTELPADDKKGKAFFISPTPKP
jgi:hypothetical protein